MRRRSTNVFTLILVVASVLMSLGAAAQPFAPAEIGMTVNGYQDDFNGPGLDTNWTAVGSSVYSVSNELLRIGNAMGDPNHLLYARPVYQGTVQEVLARMRIRRFGSGPYSRGGVAVAVNPGSNLGINFSFRENDQAGHAPRHVELVNDYVTWGPFQNLAWETNAWYWLRLRQEPNAASQGGALDVFAKIWLADGSVAEPAAWQLTWDYTSFSGVRSGYAGLMAGSSGGGPNEFSEFDVDYILIKATNLPAIVVAPLAVAQVSVAITNQPQDQTAPELGTARFSVGAAGNPPPTYQWHRNGAVIFGATNAVYEIRPVPLADNGAEFRAVAANVISNVTFTATSGVAVLTVLADTNAPSLLAAQSLGLALVRVSFSEPVTAASATNAGHYHLSGPGGAAAILEARLEATQTNVLLTVSPLIENATYVLTVNDVADLSAAANAVRNAFLSFTATQPAVFITEFLANNTAGLTDTDGARSDWIEIQNQSAFPVDLAGWSLTDDPANLALWVFPTKPLQPAEFAVVFASGKDRRAAGAELHTNFRLDAEGEYLALARPDGSIASQFTFGRQRQDTSFGSTGGTNLFMLTPTPGASNDPGILGFVADTRFHPDRGFFSNAFSLTITCATAEAEIWFTLNGDTPAPGGPSSTRYTNPLALSNTTTLRAAAFLAGYAPSDTDTHTFLSVASAARQPANPPGFPTYWSDAAQGNIPADYAMDPQVVTNAPPGHDLTDALLSLPAISLVAPANDLFGAPRGIYANSSQQGDAWEREASVELIFPDGTPGFHYEAGLRVHGYTSRYHSATLKHSLRISFRDRYGPAKLRFPLLADAGVDEFDSLVLRACSTDSYPICDGGDRWQAGRASYLRDQWMRDTMRDLGQATSHGRYVNLWINGLYWGVYNLCETLDTGFAARHLGGAKAEYDVIKDYFFIDDGNRQAWDEAAALAQQGFATEAAYQRIQGNHPDGTRNPNYPVYLKLSNYIDYVMVHITSGAYDWPLNNWWSCRRRGAVSEGFFFSVWDQEEGIYSLLRTHNVFCQPFAEASEALLCAATQGEYHAAYFYDRLRQTSPSFRQRFMDRAWQVHMNGGPLSAEASAARWLARQTEIDRAIVAETARWGDTRVTPSYTRAAHWLPEMQLVAGFWASNLQNAVQRYRNAGLWPVLGPPALDRSSGYFTNAFTLAITHTNPAGAIWFTTNGVDPRAPDGLPAAGAQSYALPISLRGATRVRARVTNGGHWSPPAEATFLPLQARTSLVVTEIYYHPPGGPGVDGEAFEFLEFQNRGAFALDLSGLRFSSGIGFIFTNGTTLAAGAHWVLARDATNFAARFPGAPLNGLFTGKLNNDGETLTLENAIGDPVFSFAYQDRPSWPESADGAGDSLHRISFGNPTDAANWCASVPTPGAPAPPACRDGDHDGMPDAWELAHGLDANSPDGLNGAGGDLDGDGAINLEEFIAGTDPQDAASCMKISSITVGSEVTLGFMAVSNKTYTLQGRPGPTIGPWTNLVHIGTGATDRFLVITNTGVGTSRWYRLATPRQQ